MINLSGFAIPVIICFLLTSCSSKNNNADSQPDEPIFGVYKFGTSGKIQVQLNSDSTAISDIRNTQLQKSMDIEAVHNEGTFSVRHDSIFINWKNGRQIKSQFVKKDGIYSFRIGSTTYKRKL